MRTTRGAHVVGREDVEHCRAGEPHRGGGERDAEGDCGEEDEPEVPQRIGGEVDVRPGVRHPAEVHREEIDDERPQQEVGHRQAQQAAGLRREIEARARPKGRGDPEREPDRQGDERPDDRELERRREPLGELR